MKRESEQLRRRNNPQDGLHAPHKKIKAREKDDHETEQWHRVKKGYLGKNHNGNLPTDCHTELLLSATQCKWDSGRLQHIQLKH